MQRRMAEVSTALLILGRNELQDTVRTYYLNVFNITQESLLKALASKRFGSNTLTETLVSLAGARWRDQVLAGHMPSPDGLLTYVYNLQRKGTEDFHLITGREERTGDANLPNDTLSSVEATELTLDWPSWLVAVFDLLSLTRRLGVYLRLQCARTEESGSLGRLAEIIWGRRARQSTLSQERASLRGLALELESATAKALDREEAQSIGSLNHSRDPTVGLMSNLDRQAHDYPLPPGNLSERQEWFQQSLPLLAQFDFTDSIYVGIPKAIRRLEQALKSLGEEVVVHAWGEYSQRLIAPESIVAGKTSFQALAQFLQQGKTLTKDEKPISDILSAIDSISDSEKASGVEVSDSQKYRSQYLDPQQLRDYLRQQIPHKHPAQTLLSAFLPGLLTLEELVQQMPLKVIAPSDISKEVLIQAGKCLKRWGKYVCQLATTQSNKQPLHAMDRHDYLVFPGKVREQLPNSEMLFQDARALLGQWLEHGVPSHWSNPNCLEEQLILSALMGVSLDLIVECIYEYRNRNQKPTKDVGKSKEPH